MTEPGVGAVSVTANSERYSPGATLRVGGNTRIDPSADVSATGVLRPPELSCHCQTMPSLSSAKFWSPVDESATTGAIVPCVSTGVGSAASLHSLIPSPPHDQTAFCGYQSSNTAVLWCEPPSRRAACPRTPGPYESSHIPVPTSVGLVIESNGSLPSCPDRLSPQPHRRPSSSRASEWRSPAPSFVIGGRPGTSAGAGTGCTLPAPS